MASICLFFNGLASLDFFPHPSCRATFFFSVFSFKEYYSRGQKVDVVPMDEAFGCGVGCAGFIHRNDAPSEQVNQIGKVK